MECRRLFSARSILSNNFNNENSNKFDFELRYLGIDGMVSWLEESLATREAIPPGDKFLYDDDIGIWTCFGSWGQS